MSTPDRIALSIEEVTEALGLGRSTVYGLLRSGRLRSVKVGRRTLIPKRELEAFLELEAGGEEE